MYEIILYDTEDAGNEIRLHLSFFVQRFIYVMS